jgi:DNA-binding phage protein
MITGQQLIAKLESVLPHLNEKQKRLLLAAEAKALGWGGVSRVAQAAGVSRGTIHKAFEEIESPPLVSERIRKPGGGARGYRCIILIC